MRVKKKTARTGKQTVKNRLDISLHVSLFYFVFFVHLFPITRVLCMRLCFLVFGKRIYIASEPARTDSRAVENRQGDTANHLVDFRNFGPALGSSLNGKHCRGDWPRFVVRRPDCVWLVASRPCFIHPGRDGSEVKASSPRSPGVSYSHPHSDGGEIISSSFSSPGVSYTSV